MDDVEKAKELIKEIYPSKSMGDYGLKEILVLKSMKWKEQQIIEKVIEFIKNNFEDTTVLDEYRDIMVRGVQSSYTSIDELIDCFKREFESYTATQC